MGGGLMQLVAYGAQDVYLTGNPQITFFKVVYRRHTNFAVEPIQQVFNGAADFGRTVTCNINRNGDLITNMYAVVDLAAVADAAATGKWGYVRRLGYALVEETKVEIGGSKIDEQYGDWLNIWYELTHKVGQERGFAKMVGDSADYTALSTKARDASTLYVPLGFWFNRHNGLALPLIALQYHDVRVTIQYRQLKECLNLGTVLSGTGVASNATAPAVRMEDSYLLIDYVYLDSEERKRFAQASHEYLIEQLQFTGSESVNKTNKYRLNFNHPSKFLVWVGKDSNYSTATKLVAYADDGDWVAASERFARIVWLATREFIAARTSDQGWQLAVATQVAVVPLPSSGKLADLISKIDAVALGSDTTGLLAVSINDVVLTKNETTAEDWSTTVDELVALIEASKGNYDTTTGAPAKQVVNANAVTAQDEFNYGTWVDRTVNPVADSKIQLNGHDRFTVRDGNYFNYVQPWQHFSNTPSDGVNVYSFALKPEDHQPSGTCNFSRIDNATLNVTFAQADGSVNLTGTSSVCNIYTVNYNVLRVMSGMAGTAYSN
jgi:hypothetical protein